MSKTYCRMPQPRFIRIQVGLINHGFALGVSFCSLSVTLARIAFDIRFTMKSVFRIAGIASQAMGALTDSIFDGIPLHNDESRMHSHLNELVGTKCMMMRQLLS